MSDPILTAVDVLFSVLFLWAIWVAVRDRDVLARDVALILAPIAITLASSPLRTILGPLPVWYSTATTVFLLAQPLFSLKLVADIRGLPRWLLPVATAAVALGAIGTAVIATIPVVLGAIAVFVVTELTAAVYLLAAARRRSGAARVRLALAAIATGTIAVCVLALGASAAGPAATAAVTAALPLLILLAAAGYWIALLPPRPLRMFWQGTAAFGHSERLLAAPPATGSAELWADLATTAQQLTGASAIIVLDDSPGLRVAASSSDGIAVGTSYPDGSLADMIRGGLPDRMMADLLARTGSRFSKVVPLDPEQAL